MASNWLLFRFKLNIRLFYFDSVCLFHILTFHILCLTDIESLINFFFRFMEVNYIRPWKLKTNKSRDIKNQLMTDRVML